jgi:hypothetical protein
MAVLKNPAYRFKITGWPGISLPVLFRAIS